MLKFGEGSQEWRGEGGPIRKQLRAQRAAGLRGVCSSFKNSHSDQCTDVNCRQIREFRQEKKQRFLKPTREVTPGENTAR